MSGSAKPALGVQFVEQKPMMYMELATLEGHGKLVLFPQFSILKSNHHKYFNHY